jgi:general secretion pathway protein D
MSNLISQKPCHWKAVRFAVISCALACTAITAQDLVETEVFRKGQNVKEAKKCLMEGDVAYGAARYEEAVNQFSQAYGLLPDAPITRDLRKATADRYATAAVEQAKELRRKGNVAGALSLCERVLAAEVAPTHAGALAMRDQLHDPVRTNAALTEGHAKAVDEVRRALYEAQGFYDLGQFDEATAKYNEVLRIDAYNSAARRGMEKVVAATQSAHAAAKDHTRSYFLQELDAAWEKPVPKIIDPQLAEPIQSGSNTLPFVSEKMATMVVPNVDLDQVTLIEAVDFLRSQARALDTTTTDSSEKGINIVVNMGLDSEGAGAKISARRLDLKVQNVPFTNLLQMICDQIGAKYTVGDYLVTFRPLSSDTADIVTRSYRVPPDFLTGENAVAQETTEDIFDQDAGAKETLLPKRMSAMDKLKKFGIPFPDGTFANYNPAAGSLTVRHTTDAQDMVQNLVDMAAQVEPVAVNISIKVVKIQNVELNELGMDWVFNELGVGNGLVVGGGTVGNGSAINDITNGSSGPAPVTSGLRSGGGAINSASIDELIRGGTSGFAPSPQRAPGFMSVLANDLNGSQLAMIMRGFNQKKGVDTLTKPSTVVRSGQTGRIEILREFMFATEYEPPQLPQNVGGSTLIDGVSGQVANLVPPTPVTPAHPTAFDMKNIGVTMEVNPVVSADKKYVDLSLKYDAVNFDGFVNYGSPINGGGATGTNFFDVPVGAIFTTDSVFGELTPNRILMPIFSKIAVETSVSIVDGATIMLGGMIEERVQAVEDKVPVLGNLPFIGNAFQSKAMQSVRTSVLVFVTVDLQDPAANLYRNR